MNRTVVLTAVLVLVIGPIAVTIHVEREAEFQHRAMAAQGRPKALVLYHPSRDAGFSDELALAVTDGFKDAGLAVDLETTTGKTLARPRNFAVIAVVSNTFWATPDWPTLRYLGRADLKGIPVIGLIGGAGSTDRSQRKLDEALRAAGANVLGTRHFWILRPNDEARMKEPNRRVAREMARRLGFETGQTVAKEDAVPVAAGEK